MILEQILLYEGSNYLSCQKGKLLCTDFANFDLIWMDILTVNDITHIVIIIIVVFIFITIVLLLS